jgi:IS30 family transposase
MTNRLKEIFYNSETGYSGLKELQKQAKEQNLPLTYDEIKNWYDNQPINQIYKPFREVKKFTSFKSFTNQTGELYADLMDVSRFSRHNKGIHYLLNIIDLFSRYAWSFPLKTKRPSEIKPYIEQVINEIPKDHTIYFTFDNGNEFKGEVKQLLDSKNIKIFLNDPHSLNAKNKLALIERFHQTLWNMIKKYLSSNETLTYIDQIPQFISNYNNRIHSN